MAFDCLGQRCTSKWVRYFIEHEISYLATFTINYQVIEEADRLIGKSGASGSGRSDLKSGHLLFRIMNRFPVSLRLVEL